MNVFADVDYEMVDAQGMKGTCAGLKDALVKIPDGSAFMLIWCDIILPEEYEMPIEENNYIGISKDFKCRWKYENSEFEEEASSEYGVAGQFIFKNKNELQNIPAQGEFVRWLKEQKEKICFASFI